MTIQQWREPDPVGAPQNGDDPFPVDALPAELRDYANYVYSTMNGSDMGLIASSILWSLNVAEGPAWIEVDDEYREPSVLWFLAVARSGAMKSPIIKAVTKSVETAQEMIQSLDAKDRTVREIVYEDAKAKFEETKSRLREHLADPQPEEDTDGLKLAVENAEATMNRAWRDVGYPPLLMLSGAGSTGPGVYDALAKHEHVGVCMTEGVDLFTNLASRNYTSREIWLKGHDMDSNVSVMRTKEVKDVKHGSLPLLTAIQPSVITNFTNDKSNNISAMGWTARNLTCRVTETVLKPQDFKDANDLTPPLSPQGTRVVKNPAKARFFEIVEHEVLRTWRNRGEPLRFQLDPASGAKSVHGFEFAAYAQEMNATTRAANDDEESIESALAKLRGQVLRIARVFAQLKIADTTSNCVPFGVSGANQGAELTLSTDRVFTIDAESISSAWRIAWWYFRQYTAVFGTDALSKDFAMEKLSCTILHKTLKLTSDPTLPDFVSKTLLVRKGGMGRKDEKDIENALKYCALAGWLHETTEPRRGIVYYPHPQLAHWIKVKGV